MNSKYDLYKRLPDDKLLWINRVRELDEARQLVAAMESASMNYYLVYDFRERTVVEVVEPKVASLGDVAAKPAIVVLTART